MINLCNDVLNKDRRNMFPKIKSLDNKLSLHSIIFLKKQNPFKYYKSFYNKMVKKPDKNVNKQNTKLIKNSSVLSLLSKTQNHFYCVPIKYKYKPDNIIFKYNIKDYNSRNNTKNIIKNKKENSLINNNNLDFLNNTNLKSIHEYLLKSKNNNMFMNEKKQYKSYNDIFMEDINEDIFSNNSIKKDKISRGQQTISKNYILNENQKNEEIEKLKNYKEIEVYINNKKEKNKNNKKEKNQKFTISFNKNSSKNNNNINKINVLWRNLRRPVSMNYNL